MTMISPSRILDWIGFQLVMRGPWKWTCDPYTKFGEWCINRAGCWAYRNERP